MSETPKSVTAPLEGLRVIDLSRILAGPFCTMNLGDMGAEIIKIEQPGNGDDTRSWGPPFAGKEAAYFLGVNRNKRSVTLNLKSPRGQEILKSLLREADVVIENFKPGALEGFGITDAWREAEAPRLVHCRITGYGGRGPRGQQPGYDFLLQAESGLMSITGEEDGQPIKLGVAIVDVCTGLFATVAIIGALQARGTNGRGQRVETSLHASSIAMLINVAGNHLVSGRAPRRYGNGHPNIVPYRTFEAADGMIALAIGNDTQYARLAACLGHPEWVDDARLAQNAARVENRKLCDGLIADILAGGNVDRWLETFTAEGLPASRVASVDQALSDPQTLANDMVAEIEHPTAGLLKLLGIPYRFSDTPAAVRRPPPLLGADTEAVLADIAGIDPATLARLRDEGVV